MDATGVLLAPYHSSQVILVQVCVRLSSGFISSLVYWALEGHWRGLQSGRRSVDESGRLYKSILSLHVKWGWGGAGFVCAHTLWTVLSVCTLLAVYTTCTLHFNWLLMSQLSNDDTSDIIGFWFANINDWAFKAALTNTFIVTMNQICKCN